MNLVKMTKNEQIFGAVLMVSFFIINFLLIVIGIKTGITEQLEGVLDTFGYGFMFGVVMAVGLVYLCSGDKNAVRT